MYDDIDAAVVTEQAHKESETFVPPCRFDPPASSLRDEKLWMGNNKKCDCTAVLSQNSL